MATLIAVALIAFWVSAHSVAEPRCATHGSQICQPYTPNKPNTGDSGFWVWVHTYHDDIGAVAAVIAAAAALFLVWVTLGLWGATDRLAVSTEDLAVGAKDQSAEMAKARELAEKQFALAADEHNLAAKQHGLQRLQYLAEHRPRIRIRSVAIKRGKNGRLLLEAGGHVEGSLVIVNTGACDAIIREADYRFFCGAELPMNPPLDETDVKPLLADLPQKMAGHGSCLVEISSIWNFTFDELRYIKAGGPIHLWVMGAIRYSDWDVDSDRWMHFCQEYWPSNLGDGRFDPVSNASYEYED